MTFELGQHIRMNGQNLRVISLDFDKGRVQVSNGFDIKFWMKANIIHKDTIKKYKKLYAA